MHRGCVIRGGSEQVSSQIGWADVPLHTAIPKEQVALAVVKVGGPTQSIAGGLENLGIWRLA